MTQMSTALTAGRIAVLARATIEQRRFSARENLDLDTVCSQELDKIEHKQRMALLKEIEEYMTKPARSEATSGVRLSGGEPGAAGDLMRQRASLELKFHTEEAKRKEIEKQLIREQTEHREALETMSLQQKKLKEVQDDRSKLLSETGALESKLRLEINATEQAELKYQKLKASRQTMGDQATELQEQIQTLNTENERLRRELETVRKKSDHEIAGAQLVADEAGSATADAAFKRLWWRLNQEIPEVFVETNVPNEKTFERLSDVMVEFLRTLATFERHVHNLLRDLRQVSEKSDKLNHFYIMFTKNAGLAETLKDYLASGKRKGNFVNLLRALQAWTRSFASGTYKVIVRSPTTVAEEMNYRPWPIQKSFTKTEDAAIGEYYKQTAMKTIPEKLGTLFRKQAADMAYEDYNELMKRK